MIACTRRIPSNWNTTAFWLKSGSDTPYWVSGDSRELIAVRSTRVPFFFLLFFSFFFFFLRFRWIGWKGRMNASQRRCRAREDGFARVWILECDRSGIVVPRRIGGRSQWRWVAVTGLVDCFPRDARAERQWSTVSASRLKSRPSTHRYRWRTVNSI